MKRWLAAQLGRTLNEPRGVIIVLDPDRILTGGDVAELARDGEIVKAVDWAELRLAWDLDLRRRDLAQGVVVLLTSSDFQASTDLPWDIEHDASAVVRLRWPVPLGLRSLFHDLPERADALAQAAQDNASPAEIVAAVFGLRRGEPGEELDAVARLRLDPGTPVALWAAAAGVLETPLARQIATEQGNLASLQNAWTDWLQKGDSSPWAEVLAAAPAGVLALFGAGLLTPSAGSVAGLPNWVSLGVAGRTSDERVDELLKSQPLVPSTVAGWIEMASWWGQLRGAAASSATPTRAEAVWDVWEGVGRQFSVWLRSSYGTTLLSSAATPRAVHQVAPFLARRVRDGARVLLVVLDGLGFAQWHQLRAATGLKVLQGTGCLAMVPTLTSVSRQAVLSGALPSDFADTIGTTSAEPRRWTAFWREHELPAGEVGYTKLVGRDAAEVPRLTRRVEAVVVTALDQLLHGADVLGDAQLAVGVDLWARTGFLEALVAAGTRQGYEVWITSDHGNLPTVPGPVPREGQTVETAGTRVRLYPNPVLRSSASAYGEIWDPPGLPPGILNPLFAVGRRGYHASGVKVSHGGTSLDEVVIPFAEVSA